MRIAGILVLGWLLGAPSAHADRKAVEAALRSHIDRSSDGVGPKAKILVRGSWSSDTETLRDLYEIDGDSPSIIDGKLDKVEVVVDARGFAWFHGKATFTQTGEGAMSADTVVRLNGIATKDTKWKLVAIGYSEGIDDKIMVDSANKAKPAGPATTVHDGDPAIAKTVAGWFATGLAKQAATGNVIANGTAASEVGSGPAAIKLVGGWDRLKLGVYKVTATPFAGGEVAFVRAAVAWPNKGVHVRMVLAGVIVKERGAWKWVSLNFSDYTTPRHDKPDVK